MCWWTFARVKIAIVAKAHKPLLEWRHRRSYAVRMKYADRITFDPEQCGGRPCIRHYRIRVKDVLDLLAAGVPERKFWGITNSSSPKTSAPASNLPLSKSTFPCS
jgi:hypothetical protein